MDKSHIIRSFKIGGEEGQFLQDLGQTALHARLLDHFGRSVFRFLGAYFSDVADVRKVVVLEDF